MLDARIIKLRVGLTFSPFLETSQLSEKAFSAVIQEVWINGVSTRTVDVLVQSMGVTGISRSQVPTICRGIRGIYDEGVLATSYVVGIFPNEDGIMRRLSTALTEQNEEWLLQNRYLPQYPTEDCRDKSS